MEDLTINPQILAAPGQPLNTERFNTEWVSLVDNKEMASKALEKNIESLIAIQDKLYADNRYAVLIIFQAMDAAGKDGTIKHVMSGLNPQGTQVYSFKAPTEHELDHDYLWRTYCCLPQRGNVGIFNRSYYEEVLVTRVHPQFILRQRIPGINGLNDITDDFWKMRFRQINDMEKHLSENGTIIIKFFLNISKDQQKRRFLRRLEDPSRNWKFQSADIDEREHWTEYMNAYSDMLTHTSTPWAPWYVIPADRKWFMRYAVSNVLVNKLSKLDLHYPELPDKEKQLLSVYKQRLAAE
ncbi:MAG: polyphosphate kinase 2 family protein [Bacteroidia bacterium]|nr:polyphosphate kinase 2 family protein [Bacteroidia bacterium]